MDPLDVVSPIIAEFAPVPGYVNAATLGLPPRAVIEAMQAGLLDWQRGRASPLAYDAAVESARAGYATLVDTPATDVSVGPAASVFAGLVAASLPDHARVVIVTDDFTSIIFPFLVQQQRRGVQVKLVPLDALATSITPGTDLVVFSLAQSSTGALADLGAVRERARDTGALTFCDATQATGWYPVRAGDFDLTVCAAYKWLCQPRGAAYFTSTPRARERLTPIHANWYAGQSRWESVYGPDMELADDARQFDISPSWLTWVGAAVAAEIFTRVPREVLGEHGIALAEQLRSRLDLPTRPSPVVMLPDHDDTLAGRLAERGITAASRAGAVRVGFHLWNTPADVDLVAGALP
ncbi:MAG: aminotransferase class V-fold PLP-dependent enzyme [Ornithinimicrobium sp.]